MKIWEKNLNACCAQLTQNVADCTELEVIGSTNEFMNNFSQALKANSTVKRIFFNHGYLSHKGLTFEGMKGFVEALKENNTITAIDFNTFYTSNPPIEELAIVDLANALKVNKSLTALNFQENAMTTKGVEAIADVLKVNNTLKYLNFYRAYITDDGMKALAEGFKENQSVSKIDLCWNNISDKGVAFFGQALRTNHALKVVFLANNQISDEGAIPFAEALLVNKTLEEINLSSNQISDKGAQAFANAFIENHYVKEINFSSNKISTSGGADLISTLKKNRSIRFFSLERNRIEKIEGISEMLKQNETLTFLDLGRTQIGNEEMERISLGLASNKTLTSLDLSCNKITDISSLGAPLKENLFIRKLILHHNRISKIGEFAEALKKNRSLRLLDLHDNQISKDEGIILAKGIKENQGLMSLNLDTNYYGYQAARVLGKALGVNKHLVWINLDYTRIGDPGAEALAAGLQTNSTVISLFLANNQIGDKGAQAFGAMLKVNHTLVWLKLYESKITDVGYKALGEGARDNRAILSIDLSYSNLSNHPVEEIFETVVDDSTKKNQDLRKKAIECIKIGDLKGIKKLIKKGISINGQETEYLAHEGKTFLHLAIEHEQEQIVQFLLEEGANPEIFDKTFVTAFDLAKQKNHSEILALLYGEMPASYFDQEEDSLTGELLTKSKDENRAQGEKISQSLPKLKPQDETFFSGKLIELEKQLQDHERMRQQLDKQIKTHQGILERLEVADQSSHEEISNLKNEIELIKVHQKILLQAHQIKEEKKAHLETIKRHPNQAAFYLKMISVLESLIISAKSASGSFTKNTEGNVGSAAQKVNLLGEVIDLVPIFGQWGDKLIKGTVVASMTKLDEKRQKNLAQRISNLATLTEIHKEIELAARTITENYSPQLNLLALPKEEKTKKEKVQRAVLKKDPSSSAQKAAAFISAWVYEAFILGKINQKTPIHQQIINIVMRKKPRGVGQSLKDKISHKLEKAQLKTQSGEKWSVRDFFTKPGIKTSEGDLYKAKWTEDVRLGFCFGTKQEAEGRGLKYVSTSVQKPIPSLSGKKSIIEENREQSQIGSQIERVEKTTTIRFEGQNQKIEKMNKTSEQLKKELEAERSLRLELEKKFKEMETKMKLLLENFNENQS